MGKSKRLFINRSQTNFVLEAINTKAEEVLLEQHIFWVNDEQVNAFKKNN